MSDMARQLFLYIYIISKEKCSMLMEYFTSLFYLSFVVIISLQGHQSRGKKCSIEMNWATRNEITWFIISEQLLRDTHELDWLDQPDLIEERNHKATFISQIAHTITDRTQKGLPAQTAYTAKYLSSNSLTSKVDILLCMRQSRLVQICLQELDFWQYGVGKTFRIATILISVMSLVPNEPLSKHSVRQKWPS